MTIIVFICVLESPAGKHGTINLFFVSFSSQLAMEAFLLRHQCQVNKKKKTMCVQSSSDITAHHYGKNRNNK